MYAQILKANPYHDHLGRFATKDGAKFVSLGGVFDRQRQDQDMRAKTGLGMVRISREKLAEKLGYLAKNGFNLTHNLTLGDTEALASLIHGQAEGAFDPELVIDAMFGPDSYKNVGTAKNVIKSGAINSSFSGGKVTVAGGGSSLVYGAPVTQIQRTFDFGPRKDVHHDYLKLQLNARGGGVVKKLFKASFPLYERMGMKSASVYANLDGGAYAWAKYGFRVADASVPSVVNTARRRLGVFRIGKTEVDSSTATPEMHKEAAGIHKLISSLARASKVPKSEKLWMLVDAKTPALDAHFKSRFSPGTGTLVKHLMANNNWSGGLEMKDLKAYNRLRTYVGLPVRKIT